MSGSPAASRNDADAAGNSSFHHQQKLQQQPGSQQQQQHPSITSMPPNHGSSPVRIYDNHHNNVSESPNMNTSTNNSSTNNSIEYHSSSNNRGNGYGGSMTAGSSNGYSMNYNNGSGSNNRDATAERSQAAVNQMATGSPYRLSGGTPSYSNHHHTTGTTTTTYPPPGSTGSTSNNTSPSKHTTPVSTIPAMSPSRNQQHPTNMTGLLPPQSPQQPQQQPLTQMNHSLHPNPQIQLQQQFQQQNQQPQQQQQQYQLYQQRMQQLLQQQQQQLDPTGVMGSSNSPDPTQLSNVASSLTYETSERNNHPMHHRVNSETQFQNQRISSSPIKQSSHNITNNNNTSFTSPEISQPGSNSKSGAKNASSMSATTTNTAHATTPSNAVSSNNSSSKNASSNNSTAGGATSVSSIPQLPPEKVAALLTRCSWVDKTIWASRQLLGGQAVNGFMRATATVQRIKKQRARQNVKSGKSKVNTNNTNTTTTTTSVASADGGGDVVTAASAASGLSLEEQQAEENVLKNEIMNARTAKKIKQELDGGIQFCVLLHDTIRSIIQQMDPSIPPVEPLSSSTLARTSKPAAIMSTLPSPPSVKNGTSTVTKSGTNKMAVTNNDVHTIAKSNALAPPLPLPSNQKHGTAGSSPSNVSQSNASGSTLRRHRRTKHSPSGEALIQLPEVDEVTGKRQNTKKGQSHRLSDVIRYRALRQGDPVAARVTSRDLWILARVMKDYPGTNLTPMEFLRLSDSRREQLFKEKVLIQDVEEHDGGAAAAVLVSRSLVLPLPRNVSEAAEWGSFYRFYKKGSRVYAMYPQTTSLYTATVVDCSTYCRREDDIIVVEFDGDEADPATGKLPACHIPARFVTLIPKEFPGAQAPTGVAVNGGTNNSTSNSKRKRNHSIDNSIDADLMSGVLDDLAFDGDLPGLDQFDDLDFDLLGDG